MHDGTDPREMSPDEIFQEVAALLARGYARLKRRTPDLAHALTEAEGARESLPEKPLEFLETGLDTEAE